MEQTRAAAAVSVEQQLAAARAALAAMEAANPEAAKAVKAQEKAAKQAKQANISAVTCGYKLDDEDKPTDALLLGIDITIPKAARDAYKPTEDGRVYLMRDLASQNVQFPWGGKEWNLHVQSWVTAADPKKAK